MTKVQAVVEVLKKNKGSASWNEIYDQIEAFYPNAKASLTWKEGIRGVVYREVDYGRTFILKGKGIISLKK